MVRGLRHGRANHGPSDIPLHPPTATKGNTKEGNIKTRNLAYKQQELINKDLKQFMNFTNSIDFDKL